MKFRKRNIRLLLTIPTALLALDAAVGATTVTTTADSGPGSLRQAVVDTSAGGSINFSLPACPCTILLTTGQIAITKNISIIGPGRDLLTISGNNASRIFAVNNSGGSPPTLTLEAVTIKDGRTTFGSSGLLPGSGAGVVVLGGARAGLILRNARLANNYAQGAGGGVYGVGANVTIENTLFHGNEAFLGGGLFCHNDTHTSIKKSTFSENIAEAAAALGFQWATADVTETTFESNSGGWAITSLWTTLSLSSCTLSANAGDVVNWSTDPKEFIPYPSILTITNSTVNSVDDAYSSIVTEGWPNNPTETTIRNSIVTGSTQNPNVMELSGGRFISSGFNLIRNKGAVTVFNQPSDQTGTSSSPLDPLLLPIGFNGGVTRTHALRLNSPAVDRGKAFGTAFDQRGESRPSDNTDLQNAPGGDGSDIGAFEVQFPVAGNAAISGRVTNLGGVPLSRGIVTLTDSQQNLRYASINPFGYYRFFNAAIGRTYTISIRAKRRSAAPRTIFTADEISVLDIIVD